MRETYIVINIEPEGRSKSVYDETIAENIRERFKLDDIDRSGRAVKIVFSDKLDTVGTGFITALFGPSIEYLKSIDKLLEIYTIDANHAITDSILTDIKYLSRNNARDI